jgi:uncharacterized protein (DUF924 family)
MSERRRAKRTPCWTSGSARPAAANSAAARKAWFSKDAAFDAAIRERFGALVERALRGELEAWGDEPRSALAQILLLDQFTRNAFRGSARSFAGDARALAAASRMVGSRQDEALPPFMRAFVYLPFEHAEGLAMQDEAIRLFSQARERGAGAGRHARLRASSSRRDRAFRQVPPRNDLLGRQSTAEEIAFIKQPGSGF